ncbi:MAG: ELM1/GtrOC1 family putative glycosyltransferase [Gammaproteobacteria bacterium]
MKAVILSDGLDGHFNQSIGIAEMLKGTILTSYKIIDVKLKLTLFRGLIHSYIKILSKNLTNRNINIIFSLFEKIDLTGCDLLISTGGKLTVLNAVAAKKYNIQNIHNGSLRGIPNEYFSVSLVLGNDTKKNFSNVKTILPPNRFKPLKNIIKKNRALFLIGGNGSGYKFKKKDFFTLCKQIIKYTIDSGKTPIIVTSRRTKKSHELLIKDNLQNYLDDKSVWFHSGLGRVNLLNIFNLIDEIFVTEDSSSMISESISTGLHVYTIAPKRVKEDKGHLEMLYRYETIGFIKRLNFDSNFIDCTANSNLSAKRKKILNLKRMLKAQLLQKLDKLYLIKNDMVAS